MSSDAPLPSPGLGARRKPKALPTLPLSVFSPPNTGTGERFPLPQSPSTVHPDHPVDGHVVGDIAKWKSESGDVLGKTTGGIVLELTEESEDMLKSFAESKTIASVPVLALSVPLSSRSANIPNVHYHAVFSGSNTEAIEAVKSALAAGKTVDLDAPVSSDEGWDALEEFVGKVNEGTPSGNLILSNLLPPPDDMALALVKLINHPSYRSYQGRIATISLYSNIFVKFRPPQWGAPTPPTPRVSETLETPSQDAAEKEKKEWKRRIKMYFGPAFEAFGEERIIFGSARVPGSHAASTASDWYELARESIAELGVEQQTIDAIFSKNAQRAYGVAQ